MSHTKGKWFSHDNGTYIELRSDCHDGELLPWTAIGDVCASKYSEVGDVMAENASRIVDCVNACDGMESPADEISKLRSERDALLSSSKKLMSFIMHPSIEADETIPELVNMQKAIDLAGGLWAK